MYLSTIITAIVLTLVDSHGIVGDAPIYDNSDSYYRRKLDTASKNTSVDLYDPNPYCDRYVLRFVLRDSQYNPYQHSQSSWNIKLLFHGA